MMQTDLFSIGNSSDKLSAAKKYQTGQDGFLAAIGSGKDDPESRQIDFLAMLSGIDADSSRAVQQQAEAAGPTDTEGRLAEERDAGDALTGNPRENSEKDHATGKRSLFGSEVSLASLMGVLTLQPAKPEPPDHFVPGESDAGKEMSDGSVEAAGQTGFEQSANPFVMAMPGMRAGNMPVLPNLKTTGSFPDPQAESGMKTRTKAVSPEALPQPVRREQPAMSPDPEGSSGTPVQFAVPLLRTDDWTVTDSMPAVENRVQILQGKENPEMSPRHALPADVVDLPSEAVMKNAPGIGIGQASRGPVPSPVSGSDLQGQGIDQAARGPVEPAVSAGVIGSTKPAAASFRVQILPEQEKRGGGSIHPPSDDFVELQTGAVMNKAPGIEVEQVIGDTVSSPVLGTDSEEEGISQAGRVPVEMIVTAGSNGPIKAAAASFRVQILPEQEKRGGGSIHPTSDDFVELQTGAVMNKAPGIEVEQVIGDTVSSPVLGTDSEEEGISQAGRVPVEMIVTAGSNEPIKAAAGSLIQGRIQGMDNEAFQGRIPPLKQTAATLPGPAADKETNALPEGLISPSERPVSAPGIDTIPLSAGPCRASGDQAPQPVRAMPKSGLVLDSGLSGKNRTPRISKMEIGHGSGSQTDGSMAAHEVKTRGASNDKGIPLPVAHSLQVNSGGDQQDTAAVSGVPAEKGHVSEKHRMNPISSNSVDSVNNAGDTDAMNSGSSGASGNGADSGPNPYTAASVPHPEKTTKDKDDASFQIPESKSMPPVFPVAGETRSENTPAVNGPSKELLPESQSFQAELMNRIVEKTSATIQSGQSEIRIDIKPESLGHLRLQISSDNQQMTVKILAENSHIKQMIESHAPMIKNELLQQGIHVHSVKVDMLMSGGSDFAYSQNEGTAYKQQRRQEPFYRDGKKSTVGGRSSLSEPAAANHAIGTGSGRVNYFA